MHRRVCRGAGRLLAVLTCVAPLVALAQGKDPLSRDALFGDEPKTEQPAPPSRWKGFTQLELAYTTASPAHWSKARARAELARQGAWGEHVKWKVSGRADYDAAYDIEKSFYPNEVRDDQRYDFMWRETYIDVGAGNWDFRLGRQHVVWGEMVGLFFADVVSAKDLREFVLPEFDQLRIPQWAARAEYFKDDFHAEAVWIPLPSVNNVGKPGAEFYPYPLPGPPGFGYVIQGEEKPKRRLSNSNYGFRLSTLTGGWDLSAFYYRSVDASATFFRTVVTSPVPALIYQPRHEKIHQWGGTLAKDFGRFVLKAEAVYTKDRQFNVTRLTEPDGVVPLDTLDYIVGMDFHPGMDTRLNVQLFQRAFLDYDQDIVLKKHESGASLLLNTKLARNLEAQGLLIHSLNRSDWMFRPSLTWDFERNWRLLVGADIFHGPPIALFGRYDNRDRVYTELRYSF